jgi:hypothetical protein
MHQSLSFIACRLNTAQHKLFKNPTHALYFKIHVNTLRTGDADLRFNTVKLGTTANSP